ncbi:MAG: glycerol-3-phosphate dehydrogenase/oxidase [Actinobacteria bacterium]|nr:glycerol-3-phosphate dehydrogenase/oxidase [Actinomycetota bacterium]
MNFDRQLNLDRLRTEQFDVLVVGGGITGVGVALDAASRGLRTALVEREDFASGTSSKSSKLIHGGLRYLQKGEVGLVYEALHERQRLRRNAPHLVQILPFMIPILTRDGVISKKIARALGSVLWMYDLTGGWRIGKLHKRLKAAEANAHLPTINTDRMSSAYLYYDAAADDARLCVTVARTAALYGAVIANRCPVQKILHDENGKVCGARVAPLASEPFEIQARCVINAAGVWADNVRETDEGVHPNSIRPAKGIHITIPWKMVRNDIAVVIPVKVDKRSLFVVPYISNHDGTFQYTYVGTTDTDFVGGVDESQCSTDDIDYVLTALNAAINTNITRDDITAVWSGLRPLVRNTDGSTAKGKTSDLSRKHQVRISDAGMVSITGGKLTTYRKMAEHAVDAACKQLDSKPRCRTKRLAFVGARGFRQSMLSGKDVGLVERFGAEFTQINELVAQNPHLSEPLISGLPYIKAEAIFAVRNEMARTLDDVLSRRTRARIINRPAALASARSVAELIAPELQWSLAEITQQVTDFVDSCAREQDAAMVSEAEFVQSTTIS